MNVFSAVLRAVGAGVSEFAESLFPAPNVDEVGPQWLNELEAVNDGMECTCGPCPLRDEDVCDEAEADELSPEEAFSLFGLGPNSPCPNLGAMCNCTGACLKSSAAVSAAADPSPTVPSPSPASVGDEGSGEVSDILKSASPERLDMHPDAVYGRLYVDQARRPESDPGAVTSPAPGEQVLEDDLAAHIMGDFVSGQEVDALTATLIDALSSRIASALLTDFNITRKK